MKKEIISLIRQNLENAKQKHQTTPAGVYVLATENLEYCVVPKGQGINGTEVATYMIDAYIFQSKEFAGFYKDKVKASNGRGTITFIVWDAMAYFSALCNQYRDLLISLEKNVEQKPGE